MSGLIKIWIVDDSGALVRRHAARLVHDHVDGKRAPPSTDRPRADGAPRGVSRVATK